MRLDHGREAAGPDTCQPAVAAGHPFDVEIEAERVGWYELLELAGLIDARRGGARMR